MDWREKLGHPTTLVLYKTPERWRHAIYGAGGVLDGYFHLRADAPVKEAQADLTRLASDMAQKPLMIEWTTDKPGWWTGEVTNAPRSRPLLPPGHVERAEAVGESGFWHDPVMEIGRFWDIIETARANARQDRPFHQVLVDDLAALSEPDILEYYERFVELRGNLYRWDVWAAAYLIGAGCSDDSFTDFQAGLIAQGRDWYQKAVDSPDSLADHPAVTGALYRPSDNVLFYELVNYAAPHAFQRVSGDEDAFWEVLEARPQPARSTADMGEDFDFDDDQEMRRRLPRLAALCLGDSPA